MNDHIQYIQTLCEQLAQATANAQTVAESLGNVKEKIFQSILVSPANDEWLSGITVNQNSGDDEVNHIKLQLAEPLPLADLEGVFGSYQKMRGGSKAPLEANFGVQAQSESHTATLMATINRDSTDTITIRRDIRLV
jgi:hypothetical protein